MRVELDDGVGLAVTVTGGGPVLICVHGLGGSGDDFADHVAALGRRATVVVVDLRGHGASDRASAYSLDRLAADVLGVADALEAPSFRLLGHSMGGMVARRVLLAVPGRVDGIAFVSTAAGPPAGLDPDLVDAAAALARADWAALRALLEETRPLGSPAFERLRATRPGFTAALERRWEQCDPEAWACLSTEIVREPDGRPALSTVDCPTLVQVGLLDAAFLDGARALADAVPGAVLHELSDAGHHPHLEQPDAWIAGIEAWLDRSAHAPQTVPDPGGTP